MITPIPNTFSRCGYVYDLVKRVGKVAMYSQKLAGRLCAYEVHRIRTRKAGVFHGVATPETERLPSDAEWGVWGKTYTASIVGQLVARSSAEAQLARWTAVSGGKA